MPKETRKKYYAVLNGRGGPRIYESYDQYRAALQGYSSGSGKSFLTYLDACRWLVSVIPPSSDNPALPLELAASRTSESWGNGIEDDASRTPVKQYVHVGVQSSPVPNKMPLPLKVKPPTRILAVNGPLQPPTGGHPVEPPKPKVALSEEQKGVLEMALSGRNIFFTGPAGTGKSVLLKEIIERLKRKYQDPLAVAVTAPTGVAALHIGGSTIHSWAGIGLGKPEAKALIEEIEDSNKLMERWLSTRALIIDEISMMDGRLFDKLESIARHLRGTPQPFGGIQLILSGDFFQLPPVPDQSHEHHMSATIAFDATSWSECIARPVFLVQVFRQRDQCFVDLLGAMRRGDLNQHQVNQIKALRRKIGYHDGIEPTELYPKRLNVESCNNRRLAALQGPAYKYDAIDSAGWDVDKNRIPDDVARALLGRLVAPPDITLKVGAQVMLLVNLQQGALVNGSIGKVEDFLTAKEAMEKKFAIAELKNYNAPDTKPINNNTFGIAQKWPLVEFDHGTILCVALPHDVQGWKGNVEAVRTQVPLLLAWAMTIHKCQGQTLPRVRVDLSNVFEKGQAYVALSRAEAMERLEVVNFDPATIQAHERVLEWQEFWDDYQTEEDANESIRENMMDCEEAVSRWGDQDLAPYIP